MLALKEFGSFNVGGRSVEVTGRPVETVYYTPTTPHTTDPNGTYYIEQAYVQYYIPEPRKFDLPVLLVHGGGMTGANWETTPDGRPGWIQRFLEAGFATYVIDNVERGRSGWCALPGEWEGDPIVRSAQQAWDTFRFGLISDYHDRRTFPGMQFPVEALDAFAKQFVPRWTSTTEIMQAGFLAALERIGPCAVICHSQGGEITLNTVAKHPALVRHAVALEPSGFPEIEGAEGLAEQHWLFMMGDNIDAHPLWVTLMERTRSAVSALNDAGSNAELMDLPATGISGNSHMLMMDRNSDEIAEITIKWLAERM